MYILPDRALTKFKVIDVGAANEETLGNGRRRNMLSVERRWISDSRIWFAYCGVEPAAGHPSHCRTSSRDDIRCGLQKENISKISRIASGITFYAETAQESDDGKLITSPTHAFFEVKTLAMAMLEALRSATARMNLSQNPIRDDGTEGDDSMSAQLAMQLFSDLVDHHDGSSMIYDICASWRIPVQGDRSRGAGWSLSESVSSTTRHQLRNEDEDEFEWVRREMSK